MPPGDDSQKGDSESGGPEGSVTSDEAAGQMKQRKRPSFLTDLRDRKKFNPGKSKTAIPCVPQGHQIVTVEYQKPPTDTDVSVSHVRRDIPDDNNVSTNEPEKTMKQMNWLGVGSMDRSTALLSRSTEGKQRKAILGMRYGW
jgi:hypothetical protein